jgi:hypothetical protein
MHIFLISFGETVTAMQLASFVVSIYAVPLIMSGEKLIDSQDKIE